MHNLRSSNVIQKRLGLGCDRLGSVLGIDGPDAARLVEAAFERGIRFFDTSNIYGQGESERILGHALRHHGTPVTIVTKAGHNFSTWTRFAEPFKRALAPWIRGSDAGRSLVSRTRLKTLRQNFSHSSLQSSAEASLRRLNRDHIDILLLHSPPSDVIAQGDAMLSLERIRHSGKAAKIGISCNDVQSGLVALKDARVEVIELPLWPLTELSHQFLNAAEHQRVFVIARGLLSAALRSEGGDRRATIRAALISSLALTGISRLIVGTTRIEHLRQVSEILRDAEEHACT